MRLQFGISILGKESSPAPQQFVADLPESYEKAKAAIHSAFPSVYDTKFMTFEVRKLLDKNDLYKWAGLLTHP